MGDSSSTTTTSPVTKKTKLVSAGQTGDADSNVSENRDEDEDEDSVDGDYFDESNTWSYRYSYFHEIKGKILRGGIAYLQSLAMKDLSKEYLLTEGLITDPSISEVAAITNTRAHIDNAIAVLESWKRVPKVESYTDRLMGSFKKPLDPFSMFQFQISGSPGVMSEALDSPYWMEKVEQVMQCPTSLKKLQFEGIYLFMQLPDCDQKISHSQAKLMEQALKKVDSGDFCLWDEDEMYMGTNDNMCISLSKFFGRCEPGMKIVG